MGVDGTDYFTQYRFNARSTFGAEIDPYDFLASGYGRCYGVVEGEMARRGECVGDDQVRAWRRESGGVLLGAAIFWEGEMGG